MNAPISMAAPVQDGLPALWDPQMPIGAMLAGKRGLVVGVANDHSIAYGCAARLRALGADLALTYLNAKAGPHVRPLPSGWAPTCACRSMSRNPARSNACSRPSPRAGAASTS